MVLALRGNRGSDLSFGEIIASVLFDEERVEVPARRVPTARALSGEPPGRTPKS